MKEYLDLLRHVYENGEVKQSRAELLSEGRRKPYTKSVFGYQFRLDLRKGFPILTTKRMNFEKIASELLWFLSGSTNNDDLNARGVTIWDEWAKDSPDLGPIYGKQWRRWEGPDGIVVDQVGDAIENIRKVIADPQDAASRRILVTAWNPGDAAKIARDGTRAYGPMGCHTGGFPKSVTPRSSHSALWVEVAASAA
jgi:thymidylate synthase